MCGEHQRLLAEYNAAVNEWAKAVQHLKECVEIDSNDYMILQIAVDEAHRGVLSGI